MFIPWRYLWEFFLSFLKELRLSLLDLCLIRVSLPDPSFFRVSLLVLSLCRVSLLDLSLLRFDFFSFFLRLFGDLFSSVWCTFSRCLALLNWIRSFGNSKRGCLSFSIWVFDKTSGSGLSDHRQFFFVLWTEDLVSLSSSQLVILKCWKLYWQNMN